MGNDLEWEKIFLVNEITKYSKFYNKVLVVDHSAPLMLIVPQLMPYDLNNVSIWLKNQN